ncbi:ABC transporter permease [Pseudonocardia phyllosphaerae]|uniref:ABC transporter permease n=1 Tax=Pseudonocardia phyllosphaerae TaxID=3390502 RepID=UPI00397CD15E
MTAAITSNAPHAAGSSIGVPVGTGALARLALRRDRLVVAAWVVLVALLAIALGSAATTTVSNPEVGATLVAQTSANPTLLALRGPLFGPTPGALTAQTFGTSGLLIVGVISLLLVVRHTRADEQAGRAELLGSASVSRAAPVAAALLVVVGANVVLAVLTALALLAIGLPAAGSLAFGLGLGAGGAVFASLGAVVAQWSERAGTARALGLVAAGVLLLVAGAGDLSGTGLVWLSPFGWLRHLRPFAGEQWWVLALFVAAALALAGLASILSERRDLGAGLVAARPGPAGAGADLRGPFGLAWRVQRGTLVGGVVAALVLGIVLGAAVLNSRGLFDTPAYRDLAASRGTSDPVTAFLSLMTYVLAQVGAAGAVAAALRVRSQETGGLGELLLSGPVDRRRWAGGHLLAAAALAALVLLALGVGTGIAGGAAQLAVSMAYLPACLLFVGLGAALTGWAPRLAAPVTWALLAAAILADFVGEFGYLDPHTLRYLSPFAAISVPLSEGTGLPAAVAVLVGLGAALTVIGLIGLRRRDIDSS